MRNVPDRDHAVAQKMLQILHLFALRDLYISCRENLTSSDHSNCRYIRHFYERLKKCLYHFQHIVVVKYNFYKKSIIVFVINFIYLWNNYLDLYVFLNHSSAEL